MAPQVFQTLKYGCIFSALEPLTIALALVGKLGPAGAFGVIYVFSAELYPTVLRNAGMGASSCVARFGGMVAPYVAKMVITVKILNIGTCLSEQTM